MKVVKATVGAVIYQNNSILLQLRNHQPFEDYWALPGGHIEYGESVIPAVEREIKEETGLDLHNIRFFHFYTEYFPDIDWHAVVLVFLAEGTGIMQKQDTEVKELRWFSMDDIDDLPLAFNHRKVIQDFKKTQAQ
jgi:8-oxo-dGTP diphosphatase